jgi:membrane-associated phospholipid phosphatase
MASASVPTAAAAETVASHGRSPYELDLLPHSILTGMAFVTFGALQLLVNELPGGLTCTLEEGETRCDPMVLNGWDRTVVGYDSRAWRLVSDAGLGVMAAGTLGATVLDALLAETSSPGLDLARDLLVIAEATAVALLCAQGLKFLARRPRPTHYREGAPVESREEQLSFPSGHATLASVLAVAYATTFSWRHPRSPWRFVVYAGAGAVAVVTALARVFGGRHFYTDIVAGTLLGAASGFLIPYWHRRTEAAQAGSGPAFGIQPLVGPSTVGVRFQGLL